MGNEVGYLIYMQVFFVEVFSVWVVCVPKSHRII